MNPCVYAAPSWHDILLGAGTVVLAVVACAYAIHLARTTRNYLYAICALGLAALVAGIVGQHAWPPADAALGCDAARTLAPGPWDAGVHVPLIALDVTPVALGGMLLTLVGVVLVLLFEVVERPGARPAAPRGLEEDDTV